MLEKLVTEEEAIPNGFTPNYNLPPPSSNHPTIKKKRNLPGTPGKYSLKTIFVFATCYLKSLLAESCFLIFCRS